MNNQDLQDLTVKIAQESFNQEFKHQIKFNNRLRTTGGRYYLKTGNIDVNPKMLVFGTETIIGIVKHELTHYFLHQAGIKHTHRSKEFKRLLNAVAGLKYAPRVKQNPRHTYQCRNCSLIYHRQRVVDIKKYNCGKCGGKLVKIK